MQDETVQNRTNDSRSFGTKMGQLIGHVFAACIAACVCSIAIALTIRFITWIF